MKFGQLVKCKMKYFFFKNHAENVVEKLFRDSFLKSQKVAYLWINSIKFYTVCFFRTPS